MRYERAREAGVIASQAVLIAVAVDWEGRRYVIGVALANPGEPVELVRFPAGAQGPRGQRRVELVVSDDHVGLTKAIQKILPEAAW
jgi:putative transposase